MTKEMSKTYLEFKRSFVQAIEASRLVMRSPKTVTPNLVTDRAKKRSRRYVDFERWNIKEAVPTTFGLSWTKNCLRIESGYLGTRKQLGQK